MKTYKVVFTYSIILIGISFCEVSVAKGVVNITFRSLKQYQQLCFKSPFKLEATVTQINPRQVSLSFSQPLVFKKGQGFPNFITINMVKGNTKKFLMNFGKPYRIAQFQKDNYLYLDLYPEDKQKPSAVVPWDNNIVEKPKQLSLKTLEEPKPIAKENLTICKSTIEEALILEQKTAFPISSFVQGKLLYILWPSTVSFAFQAVPLIPGITKIEWLEKDKKIIGMVLTLKPYYQFYLCKQKNQWLIKLRKSAVLTNYHWEVHKDTQGRASYCIEDVGEGTIEDFVDPLTGNILTVVYSSDQKKLESAMETVEMKVFPSLIGLIIQKYKEDLNICFQGKNVIISHVQGLTISVEEERSRNIINLAQNSSIFGGAENTNQSWTAKQGALLAALNQSGLASHIPQYFELIKFYLSTGFAEEAFSFLQKLAHHDPLQQENELYKNLLAITYVLRGKFEEALVIFEDQQNTEDKEISLWTALTRIYLGQNLSDFNIFENNFILLKEYPIFIRMKFVFPVVSYFLRNQKLDQAKKILTLIDSQELESNPEELEYLKSLILYKEGKQEIAVKTWQNLSKNFKTRVGIEANLSVLEHQTAANLLSIPQIIKQLKSLRYRWRDDEIEIRIINKLIIYYLKQKEYRLALNEMQYLENNFATRIDAQDMRRKIQEQLVEIYMNQPENFSLINALSLYKDYQSYFPKDERMKIIRSNLAEKLFAIGLVNQGIFLLSDQLKNATLEEKAVIGTRMAEIYVQTDAPNAALNILSQTANDTIPPSMILNRQLIEAQSLALIYKYDEALSILQHRTDKKAMLLKCDILLNANRWTETEEILQEFLEKENIDKTLNEQQSQLILDLAFTAALSKKSSLLNNLRVRYFDLMQKTDLASLFDFITKKTDLSKIPNDATISNSLEKADAFAILLTAYKTRLKKNFNES